MAAAPGLLTSLIDAWSALEGPLCKFIDVLQSYTHLPASSLCTEDQSAKQHLLFVAMDLLQCAPPWVDQRLADLQESPTAQRPLAEQLLGPATWLHAAEVCRAAGACKGWREALAMGRGATFARWQPLAQQGGSGVSSSDAAAWCIVGGMVHLQGKVELSSSATSYAGGCTICVLPPEGCPQQQLFFEQARARERDNVRLTVHTDGRVRVRPAHSAWLAASWRSAAAPELPPAAQISAGSSLLQLTQLSVEGGVHLAGWLRPEAPAVNGKGYATACCLPAGVLASNGFRPVSCHQARRTEGTRTCLWIGADGDVQVPAEVQVTNSLQHYPTQIACTFYAGSAYKGLHYEPTFLPLVAPETTLGWAFADGLVFLQGLLQLTHNSINGPFHAVTSLPPSARPARTLVLHLVEATKEHSQSRFPSGATPWATRMEVRTDGSLWLRPARSVWVAAVWRPSAEQLDRMC